MPVAMTTSAITYVPSVSQPIPQSSQTRVILSNHTILFSNEEFYEEYSNPFTIRNELIRVVNKIGNITVRNNDEVSLNKDELHQNIGRIVATESHKQYQDPFDKVYKFFKADIKLTEQYKYQVSNSLAEGKLLKFFIKLEDTQFLTLPIGTEIYIKELSSTSYDSHQYVESSMGTGLNSSVYSMESQPIQTSMYAQPVYQQCKTVGQKYKYLNNKLIMYRTSIEHNLTDFPLEISNFKNEEIYVVNESENFNYLRIQIGERIDESIHNNTYFIRAFNDTFKFLIARTIEIPKEYTMEVSTGNGKYIVMKFKNDETGYNGRAIPDGSRIELAF